MTSQTVFHCLSESVDSDLDIVPPTHQITWKVPPEISLEDSWHSLARSDYKLWSPQKKRGDWYWSRTMSNPSSLDRKHSLYVWALTCEKDPFLRIDEWEKTSWWTEETFLWCSEAILSPRRRQLRQLGSTGLRPFEMGNVRFIQNACLRTKAQSRRWRSTSNMKGSRAMST